MKRTVVFCLLLLSVSFINICAEPYQKEVWKLLDKAHKVLLTNPDKSIDYTLQAIEILKQTTDSVLTTSTLIMCGRAYMLQGNFDLSTNIYYEALSFCPLKEKKMRADITVNLGVLYGSLKDYSKALELIDGATSAFKALNDSSGIANAYNARGLIHIYMEENDIADKFFKSSLRINKALKNEENMAANINNLCLYEGNSEEKIILLKEAIAINERLNSVWSLAENYNNMGVQLFFAKKYDEAIIALKKASVYASEINAQELICDNYKYFSQVYSAQNRYKLAYDNLLNYQEKEIKLLQERRLLGIERRVTDRKMQNKEKEAALLYQKHQIEILKRNILIVFVFVLCLFLLIFFLMKQYKRKKNLQIAEAQAELLSKDKIITDLKLRHQSIELEKQSKKLESTQGELINFVLFVDSRNELLDKIREMIKTTYKMEHTVMLMHLKKISTFILQFKKMEEEDSSLIKDIDEQNTEFLNRLLARHPNLTSGEKKLATLLRINLSTKEISLLTGISIKAIGMTRYRLRKSLEIDPKDDISIYLREI